MTPELTALALAGLLQALQYALLVVPANRELGVGYTSGPRDAPPPRPLSPRTGRIERALANHGQALILFTLAVVVVTLGKGSTPMTATCGWLYLAARGLYVPAYVFGWRPWRSAIWSLGFFASLAMIVVALF